MFAILHVLLALILHHPYAKHVILIVPLAKITATASPVSKICCYILEHAILLVPTKLTPTPQPRPASTAQATVLPAHPPPTA